MRKRTTEEINDYTQLKKRLKEIMMENDLSFWQLAKDIPLAYMTLKCFWDNTKKTESKAMMRIEKYIRKKEKEDYERKVLGIALETPVVKPKVRTDVDPREDNLRKRLKKIVIREELTRLGMAKEMGLHFTTVRGFLDNLHETKLPKLNTIEKYILKKEREYRLKKIKNSNYRTKGENNKTH